LILLYLIKLKKDIVDKMDDQDPVNANGNAEMPAVPSNADEGPPSAEVEEESNNDEAMKSVAPESQATEPEEDDSEMI
jgi:hypothetical protein